MTSEKALELALPSLIIIIVIAIVVTVWLCRAISKPRNKRISILLNGFAVISFFVGDAITVGPNPKHYYGGFKYAYPIATGPKWGFILGSLLALVLYFIARNYAKKGS